MSDIQTQPIETVQPENPTTATEPAAPIAGGNETEKFTIDDIVKRYFAPDQLEKEGQDCVRKVIAVAKDGQIKRNFNPTDPFPAGYGLAIIPLSKRSASGEGNITIGIAIAAIPDPEIVGAHEKGSEFIRSVIIDTFMAKVANACRPRADGTTAPTIPYEITDFLDSRRGRETLKAFTEIAPRFVKALRKKGIRYMTAQILRQTLQSKQFAESQFEKIPQEAWHKVLDGMIVKATAEGHDPAVLVNWKDTRDQTQVSDMGDIALEEFDDLV